MINIGVQVELKKPEDFLVVKETLTRIGVASNQSKTIYQTAHILHKRGNYYICHFKELFLLDGRTSDISAEDIARRNLIVSLLKGWGLVTINNLESVKDVANVGSVKVIPYEEKKDWNLVTKYTIGSKRKYENGKQ